jgi:hypothetical protein
MRLTATHVFLRPYAINVNFSVNGAEINLKLKGMRASEKYPKIPYEGISL